MDLATIEMERPKARVAFLEYRRAVAARHTEEDEALMTGYRALARGLQVISLRDTIKAGGTVDRKDRNNDNRKLPALGVARADAKFCWTEIEDDGTTWFFWGQEPALVHNVRWDARLTRTRLRVPGAFEPGSRSVAAHRQFRAMVPSVPAGLRPRGALSRYFTLWEADWRLAAPPAPRDPALLRPLGHGLYAVVAIWDLSPLERAVLGARG
jgi:hypothetical protein